MDHGFRVEYDHAREADREAVRGAVCTTSVFGKGTASHRDRSLVHALRSGMEAVHSQHVSIARIGCGRDGAFSWRPADVLEQREVREPEHDHSYRQLRWALFDVSDAVRQQPGV